VKFGEVVRLHKETCKDPVSAGIERVIGLEHLEPGDLRVRSWGEVADGTTFTNRVRPGQVLFGKRRAYQRKVAVAEFDADLLGRHLRVREREPVEATAGVAAVHLPDRRVLRLRRGNFGGLPLAAHELDELGRVSSLRCLRWRSRGDSFLEVLTWNLCTGKNAAGPAPRRRWTGSTRAFLA
jgi:hypothetical protein